MKLSDRYWEEAVSLTHGNLPGEEYFQLRNAAGITGDDMWNWATANHDKRAFFFFMCAEEARIHGD